MTKAENVPPAMTIAPSAVSAMDERSPPTPVVVALPPVPNVGSRPNGCTGTGAGSSSRILSSAVAADPVGQHRDLDGARLVVTVPEEDAAVERDVVGAGDGGAVACRDGGRYGAAAAAGADHPDRPGLVGLADGVAVGAELQGSGVTGGPRLARRGLDWRLG